MAEFNLDTIHGNIAFTILSQSNGLYSCEVASTLADSPIDPQISYGQSADHAISIALEQLAHAYRERAEEQQNLDSLAVERSSSGEVIEKEYHVVVHFEHIITEESKFEAFHNTIVGNTVVENAQVIVVQINSFLAENLSTLI